MLALPPTWFIETDKFMLINYRTKDGMADYRFSFEYQDGGYRAYIIDMPSYGGRSEDIHITHRSVAGDRRHYVCWNQPLYTLEDLKKVVALWSDLTQTYIRTGRTIDQQTQRNDVMPAGVWHAVTRIRTKPCST